MAEKQEGSPFVVPKLCIKRVSVRQSAKKAKLPRTDVQSSTQNATEQSVGGLKLVLRVSKDAEPPASDSGADVSGENTEDGQSSERDSETSKDSLNGESEEVKLSSFLRADASGEKGEPSLRGSAPLGIRKNSSLEEEESVDSPKQRRRRKKRFRFSTPAQKTKGKLLKTDAPGSPSVDTPSPRPKRAESKKKESAKKEETPIEDVPPAPEASVAEETDSAESQATRFPSPPPQVLKSFSPLQQLLDHLLKGFLKKDPDHYFAYPVTDEIAPNYSTVVTRPMEFLTIRSKIDANEYKNLKEFKADIDLISSNATLYNQRNTVFFVAARKLQNVAEYMFSKEKLNAARKTMPQLSKLTLEDLGLSSDEIDKLKEARKEKLRHYACIVDDMCPEEVLEQARSAAASANEKLHRKHQNIEVVFGNAQGLQGATKTLKMLLPEHIGRNEVEEGGKSGGSSDKKGRSVVLGDLIPKLKEGTPGLPRPEDKDLVVPVTYLDHGAFSSFAPFYDSTWATLNKEESDLVLGTFGGDEQCVRYIDSIRTFAGDSGDFASAIVEGIVDAFDVIGDPGLSAAVDQLDNAPGSNGHAAPTDPNADTNESNGEVIPNPFLDSGEQNPQHLLDSNSAALQELLKIQQQRLSSQPPFVLTRAPGPSENEISAASKVLVNLQQLSAQVAPGQLVSASTIREATEDQETHKEKNDDDCDMDILREFFMSDD